MSIKAFDHISIPIENVEDMVTFYKKVGFDVKEFENEGATYYAVYFGENRINFHIPEVWRSESLPESYLRGDSAVPGCGDLCFVWEGALESLLTHLSEIGVEIVKGPVEMAGGREQGNVKGKSVYIRDPDLNLLEFIVYP